MNETRADAALVAAHLAGDRTALAGIYDRYADSLYDTAAAMLSDRNEAADVMQDVFLIAAERLDQLRDQTRLKPWLFAILRNQVFTRSKRRGRTRPTDFSAMDAPEVAAPTDPLAEGESAAYAELAELMRSAAAGLEERDQLVLEYTLRHDLTGADLADALGVSLEQSYVLVHRMRDRVERGIGALTVARMGRKGCPDLRDVLAGWDGTFSVLIRKRVARHVEGCDVCAATKRRFAVLPMMGAAPALAAPAFLREQVLERAAGLAVTGSPAGSSAGSAAGFTAPGGFPSPMHHRRRVGAIVAAAIVAIVLLIGGGLALGLRGDGSDALPGTSPVESPATSATTAASSPSSVAATVAEADVTVVESTIDSPETQTTVAVVSPTTAAGPSTEALPLTTAPVVTEAVPKPKPVATVPPTTAPAPAVVLAPGHLDISTSVVDLGGSSSSGSVTLGNSGGEPVTWSIDGSSAGPFAASTNTGALAPGVSVEVQFTLDRATAAEGALSRSVGVASTADGGGTIELRAIVERSPRVTITQPAPNPTCPPLGIPTIVASVADESGIASVQLQWSGPGAPGSAAMQFNGGSNWSGSLGVDYVEGQWSYTVTATDSRGNVGSASAATTVVCPPPG